MKRLAIVVLAVLVALVATSRARAAAPVDLRAQADADVVGLGDVVHVTLQATSSGSTPIDPQIGATGGFTVAGISPSTSTQMTIVNGVMSTSRILNTVWTLRAQKIGTSVIGPLTVSVDGTRYRAGPLHVRVVPPSQAPPRPQQRNPHSPFNFDPFNGLMQQFGGQPFPPMPGFPEPEPEPVQPQYQANPKLALDAPRAPVAFLHAVVDKSDVVVGEQVTYSVLIYIDPQAVTRNPDLSDAHEAPASDFLRQSLQKDGEDVVDLGIGMVGGRPWAVNLVRKSALFPLKTGDLAIGQMKLTVGARGAGERASEDLHVRVSEPPIDGRPPGYAIGDVGQLQIAAEVTPRDVEQEGAIGVDVTVSGTGNVPARITPPEQRGVEWLEPQVTEKLGPQANDRWGGSRTFRYVVRMHRAGNVDLGEIALPFWNPDAKRYEVARAPLGVVKVAPGAAAATRAEAPPDPLPGLPAVRDAMEKKTRGARAHLTDAPLSWIALGAMPLAYAMSVAAASGVKRARARRAARSASPREELKARIAAAEAASASGDARAIDAATARAIEAACVAGPGVKVRALGTSEVARALIGAKVDEATARDVEAALRAGEDARFSAPGGDASDAVDRWVKARAVIARLAGTA